MTELLKNRVNFTYRIQGKLVTFDGPQVMGIINLTNDSFYESEGSAPNPDKLLAKVAEMQPYAAIIDLGAASTRPGAEVIDEKIELERLIPVLDLLVKTFPGHYFSVDTYHARVAQQAVDHGASMINDISGGSMDNNMFDTVARLGVPYIMMHIQGIPGNMQNNPVYQDVVKEVLLFLSEKKKILNQKGFNDIIIDPGFGFGKNLEHNYQLLNHLEDFSILDRPILAGLSRKSMIQKVIGSGPTEALNGSSILNTIALQKGAAFLRVHDPREAWEAIQLVTKLNSV